MRAQEHTITLAVAALYDQIAARARHRMEYGSEEAAQDMARLDRLRERDWPALEEEARQWQRRGT